MRHIRDCFGTKFNIICAKTEDLKIYNTTVQRYLPAILQAHCWVVSFQNGCLILGTTDSSWASQLRYLLPELRDQLRAKENWYQLISIKIVLDVALKPIDRSIIKKDPPNKPSPWHKILQSLLKDR